MVDLSRLKVSNHSVRLDHVNASCHSIQALARLVIAPAIRLDGSGVTSRHHRCGIEPVLPGSIDTRVSF